MKQEVNFYRHTVSGREFVLELPFFARAVVGLVILLGVISAVGLLETQNLKSQLQVAQDSLATHEARLIELRKSIPEPTVDQGLIAQTAKLEQRVNEMKELLTAATSDRWNNRGGFSESFSGLARRTMNEVWLTSIRFSSGGKQTELAGKALMSDKIPQLVKALGLEVPFKSMSFSDLTIHSGEQAGKVVEFVLRSSEFKADNNG